MLPSHSGTILVVDDDVAHQRILTRLLLAEGYNVTVAASGVRALALARSAPPNLIILDVGLPDASGHAVYRQLRDVPALCGTPIIFISGAHETVSKLDAFALGAVDFIDKPFQAVEVLARVRMHLAMNRLQVRLAERTAELQQANERLAQSLNAKDEFLATMSHELRTPLNAILGVAEILGDGSYGPLEGRQLQAVQTVVANGQHLLGLINDILDLAKIEAGREELALTTVAPAELCMASIDLVQESARAAELEIIASLDPTLAPITVDPRRVTQILVNLLANAVSFTAPGGQVGLCLAAVGSEAIQLTVWDTGAGISGEQMGRLFRAFTQIEGGLRRRAGGTGLGLALVARLVRMHGGSVALTSEVGVGSRFSVTLPRRALAPGQPAGSAPRPGAPLVLAVDDYGPSAADLLAELERAGYGCALATSLTEASEVARTCEPTAAVVALPMGDPHGEAILRQLRAHLPATAPIVALGAVLLPDSATRAITAGATAYLGRPLVGDAVAATLARLLGRAGYSPERNVSIGRTGCPSDQLPMSKLS